MRFLALAVAVALLAACGDIVEEAAPAPGPKVRILLVGDVMLGRGVAAVADRDPDSLFEGVRHLLTDADLTGANLESPLTMNPHVSDNEHALEADPVSAGLLAAAGFNLLSVANNHATDAGAAGVLDTLMAVRQADLEPVGAGPTRAEATAAASFEVDGLQVGLVAFDATGVADTATDSEPGVASWNAAEHLPYIEGLNEAYDLLVVSIHGGTEYLPATDPGMAAIAADLAAAGVDVVWGHGAHVIQPVQVLTGEQPTVAATSLGNFLFDQAGTDRNTGAMLEVLADGEGVIAYRVGITEHPDRRVEFVEWQTPPGDAAWLHDSWWTLTRPVATAAPLLAEITDFRLGDLVTAARGDINGDGTEDLVASFRRPHRSTPFMELHPEVQWADSSGRSAHLGIFDPDDLDAIWVAGSVLMPVAGLAICDGAIATVHDQLDDPSIVAAGAWQWNGFGFDTAPDIPGSGRPGCADIDGDGATEPVITGR